MAPVPVSSFAKRTARLLTTRYVVAIASVAVLSAAGQILVQVALSRQALDARVINLAGRQRNYSQALCKALLATLSLPPAAAAGSWAEADDQLPRWERVHRGLRHGDPGLDLPGASSTVLAQRLDELDPAFNALATRIHAALEARRLDPASVTELLASQHTFLAAMEQVVSQLDREARARVEQTRLLEISLFAILALVLAAEILVIFRPAVRRIQIEIENRERAEAAAIEREVAEVSGRLERRIGQDLHDGLGQLLTGISFQAKALERRLGSGPGAEAAAEITTQVAQAIAQTRSLARLLHPVEADAGSLGAALHELGVIAEKVFRVQAVVQWDDDLPIPLGSEDPDSDHPHETPPSMHLFRIAQEAMSNAIRHGGAQHIWLSGIRSDGFAALVIADDGTGFTPPSAEAVHQPRTGMGLRIMAYRAEHIGATCTLERRPEGGMQVTIRWPIPVA